MRRLRERRAAALIPVDGQAPEAERGDPLAPSWPAEYESAAAAVRAASRRVEALEQLRAAQLERDGQRAAAVKSALGATAGMATGLVGVPGFRSPLRPPSTCGRWPRWRRLPPSTTPGWLRRGRSVAELGLRVRDDLDGDGAEHDEGVLDGPGLRAGRYRPGLPGPRPGWSLTACGRCSAARGASASAGRGLEVHVAPPRDRGPPGRPGGADPGRCRCGRAGGPAAGDRPQRAGRRPHAATEDSQRGCQRLPARPTAREEDAMTDRDGALDRLVETVFRAHDPRARAIDHFAEAVSAIFADAAERDGANQELHMRLMDVNTQARALSVAPRPGTAPPRSCLTGCRPTAAACRRGCGASGPLLDVPLSRWDLHPRSEAALEPPPCRRDAYQRAQGAPQVPRGRSNMGPGPLPRLPRLAAARPSRIISFSSAVVRTPASRSSMGTSSALGISGACGLRSMH